MGLFRLLLIMICLGSSLSQMNSQIFPLRFDLIINRIRHYQYLKIDKFENFPFIITSDRMFDYISSLNTKDISICVQDFERIMNGTLQMETWALNVIDAWGKPLPSGLLKGNVFWTGNYDQCIEQIYVPENKTFITQPVNTQHCTLFPITSTTTNLFDIFNGITVGMCVPSSCSKEMITLLIESLFNSTNITEDNLACSNDYPNGQKGLTGGAIATCIILSLLAFLVFIGTLIDLILILNLKYNEKINKEVKEDEEEIPSHSNVQLKKSFLSKSSLNSRTCFIFLSDFSGLRTLNRIFSMKKINDENSFVFLNGIRVLSLFWVIIGHSLLDSLAYTSNIIDVLSWTENIFFQLVINATFSVDTFFVISAFLTAILFVRQVQKEKISWRLMILYYVHRYIRLTPPFLLLLLLSINLTPYFGGGPFYPREKGFESSACRDGYWWTSILYIDNLFQPDKMCFGLAWYLFNDMQFYWIAPLALLPFVLGRKWIAFIITISFILVGIFSIIGILLYYPNMTVNTFDEFQFAPGVNFFNKIYVTPWCRIPSYAVGLLIGFLLMTKGKTYRLNIYIKIIGTLLAIGIMLACLFSVYSEYADEPGLSRTSLIIYQSLSRTGWSLSIGWIIFLCSTNQGGIVNRILSWPIWFPFARLNYAAFLVHPTILYIFIFNRTIPFYYQTHLVLNNLVSHIFFSYAAAVLVNIFLETPFVILEKKLFKPRRKNQIAHLKD